MAKVACIIDEGLDTSVSGQPKFYRVWSSGKLELWGTIQRTYTEANNNLITGVFGTITGLPKLVGNGWSYKMDAAVQKAVMPSTMSTLSGEIYTCRAVLLTQTSLEIRIFPLVAQALTAPNNVVTLTVGWSIDGVIALATLPVRPVS